MTTSACATAPAVEAGAQNYADRQAIETTLVRYTTGLDTLDADTYVSAFAEDAEFTIGERTYRGRDEIRTIITDLVANQDERASDDDPANDPPASMHHVMSNGVIDIVDPDTAYHRAYWMTVVGGGRDFRVAAQGRYEDELVKRGGEWLLLRRTLMQ
jgi:3-phenylpropionate/cinnamic acid dioxygenase small subunit